MERRGKLALALVAGMLAFVVGSSTTAHAVINSAKFKCQASIAKEGTKYVQSLLKLYQKCRNANLKTPGSCTNPDPEDVNKIIANVKKGLTKKCTFLDSNDNDVTPENLLRLGFPGPCTDPNTLNGFTMTDLQNCIADSHLNRVVGVCTGPGNLNEACTTLGDCPAQGVLNTCTGMLSFEYDSTVVGPLTGTRLPCQVEVGKSMNKYIGAYMKAVQKCRNNLLDCDVDLQTGTITCKLAGVLPENCATDPGPNLETDPMKPPKFANQKTLDSIAKARAKAIASIEGKCFDNADVLALKLCIPDQGTANAAGNCEADAHEILANNPDATGTDDLLDFEYATRGICGDNRKNQGTEECDGTSDDACPGACGAASGFFGCLCQNTPRQRVIEHSNADLDNGFSGQSHDSGIVEGGGYVSDLWDCDGPLITDDHTCTVGPSCNNAPHQACNPAPNATGSAANSNTICTGSGNFCRKTAAASVGPHCEIEFNKRCATNAQCTGDGDRCVHTDHGPPLPLSSGGVSVCIINTFTEDVVGTTDLLTGDGAVRLRQDSTTHLGPSIQQPCPVCGGFCAGPGSGTGPGVRTLCTSNSDCPNPPNLCVSDLVCSYGPNVDKVCRPNPPFGGTTQFFGNPSSDCPPAPNPLGTIDILFNPATTGSTTATASFDCGTTGYTDKACIGGGNDKRPCTTIADCPGGVCNEQCFCGGGPQKPNACQTACLGGGQDAQPCGDDTDCPGGFCHVADCRLNLADTDSTAEGICSIGPTDGTCSTHSFRTCTANSDCQPPICAFCGVAETCTFAKRNCFTNGTYTRAGTPGTPDRISAATFCIAQTSSPSVNNVAGLPGPGAITQPASTQEVGF